MKTSLMRIAALAALTALTVGAQAATVIGTFLDNSQWTLIHDGATAAAATQGPTDFLRWDPGQTIVMDLTGSTLTASGPQEYSLSSINGDTATFTLTSMDLDLDGPDGFGFGTLDYELTVDSGLLQGSYVGQFIFMPANFVGTPFNSSNYPASPLQIFLWGGDTLNELGIDLGIQAVPLPAPLLLFASGLLGLGLLRRK